ncbi:MAG: DUF2721 domain-containing protein [Bacteroidetes bacterium]|nr:DUF2721 domain-containing protein [Bacteroidota bacterium]
MEVTLNTPALLFPAITLLLLAYTNRFLTIASLIRRLHDEYEKSQGHSDKILLKAQIVQLSRRLSLVKYMQATGILCLVFCVITMAFVYFNLQLVAHGLFALSLTFLMASLVFSLSEILISTRALEIELKGMID